MLKKLQRRFILIAMVSVTIALSLIIGAINLSNYYDVQSSAKNRLDLLEQSGGLIPMIDLFEAFAGVLSPEAPYDSRYFSVIFNLSGEVVTVDVKHIAAVDKETAVNMAVSLLKKGSYEGIKGDYAYRAFSLGNNNLIYIFLDHSRELDTFYSFLSSSMAFSIIALIIVFVLLLIFSKSAIRPIAQSYEKQKRFITDAGHELKTPLTVISSATQVIELENGESKWTKSISKQVTKLTDLTNKLVLLSRMSEANGINCEPFSLSDTLSECVSYFEAVELSRDKEIVTFIEPNVNYNGDQKAIAQLFTLLTDNALKYSIEGSVIEVSLKKNGKETIITFINTCESVAVGNNNILFDRFYRQDSSRNSQKGGHGIGLSVAKAIVEAHKGKITANSPDGKVFVIKIIL